MVLDQFSGASHGNLINGEMILDVLSNIILVLIHKRGMDGN
jgi:hypothetical protein